MLGQHRGYRGPIAALLRILAVVVLALSAASIAAPSSAEAAAPCWKQLLNDWYDGRIDKAYPVKCYREAIRNLPEDVEAYSSAHDDLTRALLNATRQSGGTLGPNDLVPAGAAGRQRDVPDPGEEDSFTGALGGDDGDGPLGFFAPSNADSIPIPLLVLAGLALLLLAAAGASFVARRIQARRGGPTPSGR
jgi:hypothetical protein